MHSNFVTDNQLSPFDYLLQWEWPEHIELLLRRLIWAKLVEMSDSSEQNTQSEVTASDHLCTKLFWAMAVHPESSPVILDVISQIENSAFAERVAENPNVSSDTLERLARHKSHKVRCAVAEHTNAPAQVIETLSNDEHADVRFAIADNPSVSESVLIRLSEDENCFVVARAKQTLQRRNMPTPAQFNFVKPAAVRHQSKKFASN